MRERGSLTMVETAIRDADRCDRLAHKGTGVGLCNAPLDEHGECPRAHNHIEAGY